MSGTGDKDRQLARDRVDDAARRSTTVRGVRIGHIDDPLTVGRRGAPLLADCHFREKITYFDHGRIPERVVHARGVGACGYVEPCDATLAEYTAAQSPTSRLRCAFRSFHCWWLRRCRRPAEAACCSCETWPNQTGEHPLRGSGVRSRQSGNAAVRSISISWPGNPSCATPSNVLAVVNAGPRGDRVSRSHAAPSTDLSSLTT